ncbi:DUF4245 domain-containing protein [Cryobacterium sp. TMT1-21]|uniref:DUF4245 domain-containing protein n=2 Tax=Microbacteriaceae TaxID=85023 RepID=A0AAQ2C7Y4_9MICO|nr:DUF4245 domain-containing protein [Cryobacterium shii]TFD17019.1 DUF4245 domain-containing protein [Cryobacterium sp. TMT1-21]TFD17494.1 DUF4245 domain-containing protein [Cryobacterium sp. TMT4-10]TFD18223.1 DUF4245 domain-containing protein [Cryobacterium sp. TMT2-23]
MADRREGQAGRRPGRPGPVRRDRRMSAARRAPRVVAELGRPETPEETKSRLAENSRKYRSHKTVNNLVLSLLATLGTVLVLVLLVPRSEAPIDRPVDFATVAAQAQTGLDQTLIVPKLPTGWKANAAQWRLGGTDRIPSWYIGLLTPGKEFIGLTQGLDANPSWLAEKLDNAPVVDTVTINGVTWDVYRNTAPEQDHGNFDSALVTTTAGSTYVLVGTAGEDEFAALAEVLAAQISTNTGGTQ